MNVQSVSVLSSWTRKFTNTYNFKNNAQTKYYPVTYQIIHPEVIWSCGCIRSFSGERCRMRWNLYKQNIFSYLTTWPRGLMDTTLAYHARAPGSTPARFPIFFSFFLAGIFFFFTLFFFLHIFSSSFFHAIFFIFFYLLFVDFSLLLTNIMYLWVPVCHITQCMCWKF